MYGLETCMVVLRASVWLCYCPGCCVQGAGCGDEIMERAAQRTVFGFVGEPYQRRRGCLLEGRCPKVCIAVEYRCVRCFANKSAQCQVISCNECRKQTDCCSGYSSSYVSDCSSFFERVRVCVSFLPPLVKRNQGEALGLLVPRRVLLPAHRSANPHRPGR